MLSENPIDWEQLIHIDREWVEKELNSHFTHPNNKVTVRGYTPKASGTSLTPHSIAQVLAEMISEYVHGHERSKNLGLTRAVLSAVKYFGEKDTDTDGKYGELLLFALVEAVLGCKMVAHKLRSLSNFKDQVKGGDGIFLGNYPISENEKHIAYLIGESKLMKSYSDALKDACESINRFHEPNHSTEFFNTELIVAKDNILWDNNINLDELYDRLTPTTQLFKKQILVHPILIMHNSQSINTCEITAKTNEHLEELVKENVIRRSKAYCKSIEDAIQKHPHIKKIYLDFFIIPFNDIRSFRNALYYNIHGVNHPNHG